MKKFGFHISERLKSEKEISAVFTEGKSAFNYPLKMYYIFCSHDEAESVKGPKIAISVPKKRIKKAHDRNTVKRRIREAYRLNSAALKLFAANHNKTVRIVFVYIANNIEDYTKIEKAMLRCLSHLSTQ